MISRGERNIAWIEQHCRIPEGKFVGRPVVLTKHQRRWIIRIYDTPTRLFILSMARKNAKTALSAFLLLLHLCGPEAQPNSGLFSAAQSREQAGILFGLAAKIVRMSPDLAQYVTIRDTAKQLYCEELGTLYRALSAEVSTSFGLSPAFVVHDELGQVRGPRSELYEALETAAAAHENPLSIIISTQAPTDADLLSLLIDDALSGADPRTKVELYTAPMDTKDKVIDPFAKSTIRAANPHLDDFMNVTEVMRQAADAKRMPSRESSYRNLILNQRVESKNPFVTRSIWMENTGDPVQDITGRVVYGGLDLSAVNDLTACVWVTQEGGENWHVIPQFWIPAEGLSTKAKTDRVPYDMWADQEFMVATPGRAIQYEYIATYLRGIFDTCDVKGLAFDRYNMKFLKPWLVKEGFSDEELSRFVDFGQGFVSMSPAIRETESLLLGKQLEHGGHPVLTMCAMNAVVITDAAENKKFTKAKATGRIDGLVALVMAVAIATQGVEAEGDFDDYLSSPIAFKGKR